MLVTTWSPPVPDCRSLSKRSLQHVQHESSWQKNKQNIRHKIFYLSFKINVLELLMSMMIPWQRSA